MLPQSASCKREGSKTQGFTTAQTSVLPSLQAVSLTSELAELSKPRYLGCQSCHPLSIPLSVAVGLRAFT